MYQGTVRGQYVTGAPYETSNRESGRFFHLGNQTCELLLHMFLTLSIQISFEIILHWLKS